MTKRIEIDDGMVERAVKWADLHRGWLMSTESFVKFILEAAINPPEEPEIPVSEGMKKAGGDVSRDEWHRTDHTFEQVATKTYRAMERVRREEESARPLSPLSPFDRMHCRANDRPHGAKRWFAHRRKDDPK